MNPIELRPQPKQEKFLSSAADVAVYGGAAGSGKSFALLLEPCYDLENSQFRSVIFRRTIPMARQPGGLLDTSAQIYPLLGGVLNQSALEWRFASGATVKFAGMELEQDRFNWQGSQMALIAFDVLQEFAEAQFWFLFSRSRSMSGARTRIRATCNPDCDSWLRNFLAWWIDPDSGFPIASRSGVLRWFVRRDDQLFWADGRQELLTMFGADAEPKSVTFISANVHDNQILLETDRGYLANLKALPLVERERLLCGNWNIRPTAGNYFRREWFGTPLDCAPKDIIARCRFWDRAASEKKAGTDPDGTCGLLLGKTQQGLYVILDCVKLFATPHAVEKEMMRCAKHDGTETIIGYMQDPGSAGKYESTAASRALDGSIVKIIPASGAGSKETRARPISSQCEAGNVRLVRGNWNEDFLREASGFPTLRHDDCVDALSGAHEILSSAQPSVLASRVEVLHDDLRVASMSPRGRPLI
jgi:predicted phage terminase large subunit-like protein